MKNDKAMAARKRRDLSRSHKIPLTCSVTEMLSISACNLTPRTNLLLIYRINQIEFVAIPRVSERRASDGQKLTHQITTFGVPISRGR